MRPEKLKGCNFPCLLWRTVANVGSWLQGDIGEAEPRRLLPAR